MASARQSGREGGGVAALVLVAGAIRLRARARQERDEGRTGEAFRESAPVLRTVVQPRVEGHDAEDERRDVVPQEDGRAVLGQHDAATDVEKLVRLQETTRETNAAFARAVCKRARVRARRPGLRVR
eukprot:6049175-Prymnesium_polylepis.2